MPDFNQLPERGTLTVSQAMQAAHRHITRPAVAIMVAGTVLGILLPIAGLSLWWLPVATLGSIVVSYGYTAWITPCWRIWAYAGVHDIHQLQRAAELARLLPPQSPRRMCGIMSFPQRQLLAGLMERFEEDPPFRDDPAIGRSSTVFAASLLRIPGTEWPLVTISDEGIETEMHGFHRWEDITCGQVKTRSYRYLSEHDLGYGTGSRTEALLCFNYGEYTVEIPLSELDISAAELDHLLYIHQGRYEQRRKAAAAGLAGG